MTDKRVVRTRSSIKIAFMQLLIEKELPKITVSDITAKAQINRSTFYLHYSDVNSVMQDIEREIDTKIVDCIECFDVTNIYESTKSLFTNLTKRLNENSILRQYILYSTSSDAIVGRLKEIFISATKSAIISVYPQFSTEEIDYPLTFAASGIIDCYVKWAHSDNNSMSLEQLINVISEFTSHILEFINIK